MDYFSKEEADVIGEISNISIGSSATAMNMMLGQPITITTPDVSLVHKTEILNDYEKSCVLIRVQYTQGLYGNNILILKDEDAKIITDLMMGNDGTGTYSTGEITDLHISAVAEAMNQMTASSATAMSKMFDSNIFLSSLKIATKDLHFATCSIIFLPRTLIYYFDYTIPLLKKLLWQTISCPYTFIYFM